MPTIELFDPDQGRVVRLLQYKRRGKTYYRRVPESTYDISKASPRRLEALAAFAEAASAAYGEPFTEELPPASISVRELQPKIVAQAPPAAPTPAELKQAYYRSLITPEEKELLDAMEKQGIRGMVVRPKKKPAKVAFTERVLPSIRELQAPPGY